MSEIVPRAATEEAWRSMYVTRRLISQYGKTPGCPGCENLGEKNGPSHSTECRQRLQEQMANTSEGKIKLSEEQKRRDAFTARRMMSASHVPVEESHSSSVEHERRAQPSKRARIASEADSSNNTVMQDVAEQGPSRTDITSEMNMRDSSKRQADIAVEELEQDANNEGNEDATLNDDVEMDVQLQGEQAQGLSGVDVTKAHNLAHTTSVTVTAGSSGSSIMDITSGCPVTGTCYDFSELGDKSCHLQTMFRKTVRVDHLCTALSKLTSLSFRHTSPLERKQIANKA